MTPVKENLELVKQQLIEAAVACGRDPETLTLIGVSKRKSAEIVTRAIEAGAENLGENYIQEAVEKIDLIGKDRACWHFIGHLQSNKARFAVKYFDYIHTVDKLKLAREINKQAKKIDKIQKILLQVNIAEETTKSGAQAEDMLFLAREISQFENVSVRGLMCMPPYFENPEDARIYFKRLVGIKEQILEANIPNISMEDLSMGMSNDFRVAVEEGSTMVRVGTAIFGSRE
ncbi:YggS family pyridoxal phosphate-dependent enzyme [Desulfospira joergensenii]|uniref:YggS family pyridoxal phosphate-dependent enzyme n=1 Tax=Desulfospira joergensenii TaxID=53329 RepID=UPI0003B76204|nr:YggS family pyridoxal phosphate-dependent enzyme [Desulfospira joergensenii]